MKRFMTSTLAFIVSFLFLTAQPRAQKSQTETGPIAIQENVLRQIKEQHDEIERLRAEMAEQSRLINEMLKRMEKTEAASNQQLAAANPRSSNHDNQSNAGEASIERSSLTVGQNIAKDTPQHTDIESRLAKVEAQSKQTNESLTKQFGSLSVSGDIRLRYESTYGQLNASANGDNPAILGNELSSRQRGRIRARLALRGQVNKEFDWGLRLSTGSYSDVISANQTFTDFFTRKPFGLDQAYVTYHPKAVPGLKLQGGKFESPWLSTEMTFDVDLSYEGANESYSRDFKKSAFKNLTLTAWQLPFLENSSAFVRNANGTVNIQQSNRNSRDLAIFGAQVRARFEPAPKMALTLAASDHFFSGTQFITPVQFFGSQVQLPVTVTIPASGNVAAQTITTFATISRDLLVSGNANLGISTATNNAVNRDGHLASGFNLVDLIGRFDITRSKKFPVMLLFDFVTNTQTHDVILAGPQNTNRILPNNEKHGYWAEVQVGKTQQRGDFLLGYTFIRIEKDAVLTPFNWSDIAQQSDVRAQRFVGAYALDPHVTLSLTGIFTDRSHGLLGVFGTTPPGSLNRTTTRLQFDTTFRF